MVNLRTQLATIRRYEDSVAMPDRERATYLDARGRIHYKTGDAEVRQIASLAMKCQNYLRFGKEVELSLSGHVAVRNAVKVCDTPNIFLNAWFRPAPMLYTQRHLRNAVGEKGGIANRGGNMHGLTVKQIKRLPERLEDPILMFDSPRDNRSMLAVLDDKDGEGIPLMVVIRANGNGTYDFNRMKSNFIQSLYGKDNLLSYLVNKVGREGIIYYDDSRGDRLFDRPEQLETLREHVGSPDLYGKIIRPPLAVVTTDPDPVLRATLGAERLQAQPTPRDIIPLTGQRRLDMPERRIQAPTPRQAAHDTAPDGKPAARADEHATNTAAFDVSLAGSPGYKTGSREKPAVPSLDIKVTQATEQTKHNSKNKPEPHQDKPQPGEVR